MALSVGIVGLPNVGKSTLFNALLKKQLALAANYPFATIEPNVGIVEVPDERLQRLAEVVAGERVHQEGGGVGKETLTHVQLPPEVPATIEFVDIAGLVAGAHKGEGLGNQFLAQIREVDLIAHLVRDFSDGEVVKTGEGLEEDYKVVTAELILKDLETVEKRTEKLEVRSVNPEVRKKEVRLEEVLTKLKAGFNEGKRAIDIVRHDEREDLRELCLLTLIPEIVVVNVDEPKLADHESVAVSVAQKLQVERSRVVVVSAKIESELSVLDNKDAAVYMQELGVEESGLERLARVAYGRLGLISFLTAGEKEVRAWTIEKGTSAAQAAGVIHSDFAKHFIKAEVADFDAFVDVGGWKNARGLGKVRLEGRDYVMKDGDVVEFKIGG